MRISITEASPSPTQQARPATRTPAPMEAAGEWKRPLTGLTLGLLLFEVITGLSIYLLPFSVFNQFSVLVHTTIGVLMVVPVGWYLGRHWWRRFRTRFNHYQLLGYFSAAAFVALVITGCVLTWQAAFGTRISYAWRLVHIVATFVFIAALGAHLATLLVRTTNQVLLRRMLRAAQWSCLRQTAGWGGGALLACVMMSVLYRPVAFDETFPEGYSFRYGEDRPFAPSLARKDMSHVESALKDRILRALDDAQAQAFVAGFAVDPHEHVGMVTVAERLCSSMNLTPRQRSEIDAALRDARTAFRTTGAIPAPQLAGSAGCGTSGCHTDILEEWLPSAHRYSSMDFVFQKVQANMAAELAPEATRYCAGCHDPIALFSGAKNVGNVTLSAEGADEGTSCLVCHSMVQTDVRGNADYAIRPPQRYIYEMHEGRTAKLVSDFLIRAYPRQHVESYARPLYKTAEFCAACHKQFIDEELNEVGWVQGQNQYDSWRKSRWHVEGHPKESLGCRECHMPLVDSTDPAAGDLDDFNRSANDGRHRSHRFLAANQFIPHHHDLEGAEEHRELTVQWLRGEYEIPEIAERWTTGPVVRLDLNVPEVVHPGEAVTIQTTLTNNKTGHDFPTGPMDMIEAWVEVTVTDDRGNVVYGSARPDHRGYLTNPEIVFKAEPIDRLGQLIGRHELWLKVGSRFKRALFPGFTDTTDFVFECPMLPTNAAGAGTLSPNPTSAESEHHGPLGSQEKQFDLPQDFAGQRLHVSAILWYTKFSAPFLDRLFGADANIRSEVTDIARAEAVIEVRPDKTAWQR